MALDDSSAASRDESGASGRPTVTEQDIVFDCEGCGGELVVDREGEGVEVPCPHCGKSIVIPPYRPRLRPAEIVKIPAPTNEVRFDFSHLAAEQLGQRLEELKHQLKENRSQDTEIRGHINRATMELHRLQLRLQKLNERQAEIVTEMNAAQRQSEKGGSPSA